jgi:hypothetical protein
MWFTAVTVRAHRLLMLWLQELLQKDFDMLDFFRKDPSCCVEVAGPPGAPAQRFEPRWALLHAVHLSCTPSAAVALVLVTGCQQCITASHCCHTVVNTLCAQTELSCAF